MGNERSLMPRRRHRTDTLNINSGKKARSSDIGWVETEGAEGRAQETGIPGEALKAAPGDRVVIVAMRAAKAEGAKDDREEETGRKCERKQDRRKCPKGLYKLEKPRNGGDAGLGGTERVDRPDAGGPGKRGQRRQVVQPD